MTVTQKPTIFIVSIVEKELSWILLSVSIVVESCKIRWAMKKIIKYVGIVLAIIVGLAFVLSNIINVYYLMWG